jgi:hypothetical protein
LKYRPDDVTSSSSSRSHGAAIAAAPLGCAVVVVVDAEAPPPRALDLGLKLRSIATVCRLVGVVEIMTMTDETIERVFDGAAEINIFFFRC